MKFVKPLVGNVKISQTFDQHEERRRRNGWIYYNGGIDYAVPVGTKVYACQAGTVAQAKLDASGYGKNVRIQHNSQWLSLYGHLDGFECQAGDKVQAGQLIGYTGNTGNSTGPHLHLEFRLNGRAVNPDLYWAEGEPLEPEPDDDGLPVKMPAFPLLPTAQVLCDHLNVRNDPSLEARIIGSLPYGETFEVIGYKIVGEITWLKIGYRMWCAYRVAGFPDYCKWVLP